MPLIKVTTTNLPANSTSFPLQGNQYEYLPFAAAVATIPVIIVLLYLLVVRKSGALENL